jgi:hypothetical protein
VSEPATMAAVRILVRVRRYGLTRFKRALVTRYRVVREYTLVRL